MNDETMYSNDIYEKLYSRFNELNKGDNLVLLNFNNDMEWIDVPEEREYLNVIINAIKRGVNTININIIPKDNIEQTINNFAFKALYEENRENMLFIIREEFEKKYTDVFELLDPGLVIFNNKNMFKDSLDENFDNFIDEVNVIKEYANSIEELLNKKEIFVSYDELIKMKKEN